MKVHVYITVSDIYRNTYDFTVGGDELRSVSVPSSGSVYLDPYGKTKEENAEELFYLGFSEPAARLAAKLIHGAFAGAKVSIGQDGGLVLKFEFSTVIGAANASVAIGRVIQKAAAD